jgi:hypothetical protein
MSHGKLVDRAIRWLSGARRCNPVYAGNASCREIPDAIGWSSAYKWHGSHVVECKCSLSDFRKDKYKYIGYKDEKWGYIHSGSYAKRQDLKRLIAEGCTEMILPRMGDFRWFMCYPGVIQPEHLAEHHQDHGLLYIEGRRVRIVIEAKRRESPCYQSEIRYLRFAIINGKIGQSSRSRNCATNAIRTVNNREYVTREGVSPNEQNNGSTRD